MNILGGVVSTVVLLCMLPLLNAQVDTVLGKEFAEKYTGLTNSATALLSRLNITLHSGTIATLLELLISLLPALRFAVWGPLGLYAHFR